jgi:hypothetical protein
LIELDFWCLTPLSVIFQLYRVNQFSWCKKLEYPERITDNGQVTGKLITRGCESSPDSAPAEMSWNESKCPYPRLPKNPPIIAHVLKQCLKMKSLLETRRKASSTEPFPNYAPS